LKQRRPGPDAATLCLRQRIKGKHSLVRGQGRGTPRGIGFHASKKGTNQGPEGKADGEGGKLKGRSGRQVR